MRSFILLFLCLTGSLAMPACAQKSRSQQTTASKAATAATAADRKELGPVLTFERTPCFGTCPGYSMKVYENGRVEYAGTRAVPMMGPRELKLPVAAIADLQRQAREVHFDQFEKRYSRNTSDLPSTVIGVRQPSGLLKLVTVEEGEPENVRDLVAYFGKQFDALARLNGAEK